MTKNSDTEHHEAMSSTDDTGMPPLRFFNSSGGGGFWNRKLELLRTMGYPVRYVSAPPEVLSKKVEGRWACLWRRWEMYPGFAIRTLRNRGTAREICIATTNPFFTSWLVSRFSAKSCRTVMLLYDLFPQALVVTGMLKPSSPLTKALHGITKASLHGSDAVVFLGERLKDYVESTYGPVEHSVVIPVGADGTPFKDTPPMPMQKGEPPTVLYSGNFGRLHDTETLQEYFDTHSESAVRFLFHARGRAYHKLKAGHLPTYAQCGGLLDSAAWQKTMLACQVALVTMCEGAEKVVMPSKAYSALVAGQAILAICPPESDLADLVQKHNCGWVVEPGNVAKLSRVIHNIGTNPVMVQEMRQNAFAVGHRLYDMQQITQQWRSLFSALTVSMPD